MHNEHETRECLVGGGRWGGTGSARQHTPPNEKSEDSRSSVALSTEGIDPQRRCPERSEDAARKLETVGGTQKGHGFFAKTGRTRY